MPQGELRLHLGCADKKVRDHINVDARQTKATDLVSEAWDLKVFADNTVASIYTRHMIEHLEPDDAAKALKEWYRVLKPGSVAHIICPDLVFHAKQYLGMEKATITPDQHFHAMTGFYGWKVESRGGSRYDAHRWGYSFDTLSKACTDAGFSRIDRITTGTDTEAWHLNIKAYK